MPGRFLTEFLQNKLLLEKTVTMFVTHQNGEFSNKTFLKKSKCKGFLARGPNSTAVLKIHILFTACQYLQNFCLLNTKFNTNLLALTLFDERQGNVKNKTFMADAVTHFNINLRQTVTVVIKHTAKKNQSRSLKRTKNQSKSLKTPKICLLMTGQKLTK